MVACFASEMHAILQALAGHTRKDGTIVIDVGDSAYAGVRVPTDQFIAQSLDAAGFDLSGERVLRQRYSRSQMETDAEAACIHFEAREASNHPARDEAIERLVVSVVRFQGTFAASAGHICKT